MPVDTAALLTASEGLLASAALGASWEDDLERIAQAAGCHSVGLWRSYRGMPSFVGNVGFGQGVSNIGRPGDPPYTEDVLRAMQFDADIVHSKQPRAAAALSHVPFYYEAMVKYDYPHFATLDLKPGDGTHLHYVFGRGARDRPFQDDDVAGLDRVAANLRFAALFAKRNAELLAQMRASSFLDRKVPTFSLDVRGRAAVMNDPAEREASKLPIWIGAGRLVAETELETRRLDRVVGDAVGPDKRAGSIVVCAADGVRYQLLVMPLFGKALDLFSSLRAVASLVRIDRRPSHPDEAEPGVFLSSGFGLTSRETAVALLGAEGLAPAAIAARLGIGEGTARNHMKSAFRKAGLHSQAELAALVASYR